MKSLKYLLISLSIFAFWLSHAFADCNGWFSFSSNCDVKPVYCQNGDCSLTKWVDATGKAVDGLLSNTPLSQYAQQVVSYFLAFVSLIAVIYIIYAGFQLMIGAGDEEKMKKTKNIIIYVVVGIIIIWLAFGIVKLAVGLTKVADVWWTTPPITWSLVPEVSADGVSAYTESNTDTFRDYQWRIKTAIQNLEAELRVNGSVNTSNIQNIKNLVQAAYDRLPDNIDAATENSTAKRAVDMYLDIAMKSPNSNQKVGDAISKVSEFVDGAKISGITGDISATPSDWNAPLTVSFLATNVVDPSGTTPGNNNYIWWIRENGWVRHELGRGPSLAHPFIQEWTFTVNLDVVSGSRNSKGHTDVLPLSISKSISVKPKLGEIILLVNGVNVSNVDNLKISPTLWKMGIVLDATASRAIGNGSITNTSWDFGNGDTISYRGKPIIERQIYINQWVYPIKLEIETNDGKKVTKTIQFIVRDPSAVIQLDSNFWHVGDEMHMSALSYFSNTNNVEYSWQIQNDSNRKILKSAAGNTLNYKFDTIGQYIVTLNARSPNGNIDTDSHTITIESREPIVDLENPVAISSEKPNTFIFDASKSYDPDTMSTKWLTYTWRLDGQKVDLQDITGNGARGTLRFDSIWTHTISLTIANVYGKVATTDKTFGVDSVLSVNMLITPQVAPIGTTVTFVARSENADFAEWNFGDGSSPQSGDQKLVQHVFQKTGIYNVSLTVSTKEGWKTNQIQRKVYVTDTASPFAIIDVSNGSSSVHEDPSACWTGAIVVNRSEATTLDGSKSVNIDWSTNDLSYTWSYFGKTKTTPSLSEKFGELGCFPINLTVRSNKNGATHTSKQYLYLKNQPPELTSISTNVDTTKQDSQKVLVKVSANGATDPDGVITSYIWYYSTESDKEPQNIQITQKPEITFVLPNITEKYYFGVILEDNDGARTNSADTSSEQVPLILNNQNGNIYMPLITLSTPKTAVLAGENVHLSVEAKTIVGTDITGKSDYAWDFDGDGIIDQKTQNPSIDHIYQNSGNYTIKVRVTYNGVSNTKYQTIYVKNALKAHAHGYHLSDGSIYLLNSSEGIYDKALWNIWGKSIESLYSTLIEAGNNIDGWTLGTLTVSNNGSDVDTANIQLSDIEEVTGSGIYYQSSPKAENDTIHVKGSSDKVLLSFLGNTASRYAIDTNTEIDSDLDGIPDNDADNKDLASYNDGSVFVMKDFNAVRGHEQKIKITPFQGNTPIASKIITLIFDFVPEASSSIHREAAVNSGSVGISTFDRAKLDELSSLIRSLDDADRVILMKGYNTLIENWDDSFAKSKSLIDIQTSVNDANITADIKTKLTNVINDLLSGDSRATDDVTLSAKLIEWLVSKSPNYTVLLEKLTEIESHPQSLAANVVLAKDIFGIIQTDSSLDDATKQYIYNQLSVIKNGGSQSVPPETIQTPSTWGWILGFVGGVVKIFFLIIGIILFVILIGYIAYRVSKKDDTIGFQDFLIDSVFHAKKGTDNFTNEVRNPAATVSVESEKLSKETTENPVDPMTAFIQPEEVSSQKNESPMMPAKETFSETNYTEFLAPESPSTQKVEEVKTAWVPDWLKTPSYPSAEEKRVETPDVVEEKDEKPISSAISIPVEPIPSSSDIPDWLKEDSTSSTIPEEEVVVENVLTAPEVPPISEDIQFNEDIVSQETPEDIPENIPEVVDTSIPSWLVDSIKQEDTPITNKGEALATVPQKKWTKKKQGKTEEDTTDASKEDTWTNTQTTSGDIPDWLK